MEGHKNNKEKVEPPKEYHEPIKDPKEIKALEHFKNTIATITDKKDKAVLDPFVLLDNDFLIHFLRARKLNIKKATKMLLDYYHWKSKMNLDYYIMIIFLKKNMNFNYCFLMVFINIQKSVIHFTSKLLVN